MCSIKIDMGSLSHDIREALDINNIYYKIHNHGERIMIPTKQGIYIYVTFRMGIFVKEILVGHEDSILDMMDDNKKRMASLVFIKSYTQSYGPPKFEIIID